MVTPGRFRELAMQLPRVEEIDHFGTPSFRVRGKIFAQFARSGSDAIFKFSRDELDVLRLSAGDLFVPDPGWGKHGWTHVRIAEMDEAWCRVTPMKMHGELNIGA